MSASEGELDVEIPETLPEEIEMIAKHGEPFLTADQQESLEAAAAAMRLNAPAHDEHPRADRLLDMQMLAILSGAEVEHDSDIRQEIEAAGEHIRRALLALAVDEQEVRFDA